MQNPTHNQPEFTVSEISGAIKRTMENAFGYVRVKGEISQGKLHSSGHYYFSLKDENSVLSSVCWKGKFGSLKIKPQDGLEVIATGKISTFGGQSKYQLIVDNIEAAGIGALMALLEKRKKELEAKGLFAPERKKLIPFMPKKIGIVTSPTGAVIRDMLHRITERFPTHVVVWGVRVQGQGAENEIAEAIKGFNKMPDAPDLIIVARGGGSLEDLWCFNEEAVAYAVAESTIPIISAVGHETDTTLIDYVSDLRAPTPTAAAEFAVPVIYDLRFKIDDLKNRLAKTSQRLVADKGVALSGLVRGLPNLVDILGNFEQRLDGWNERLKNALPTLLNNSENKLAKLKLHPMLLAKDIAKHQKDLAAWFERLNLNVRNSLDKKQEKTASLVKLFESYNYKNVLKRGFALAKTTDGKLVKSATTAPDDMVLEFADGEVIVKNQTK